MWMARGARTLVDRCAKVKSGEKVLVLSDSSTAHIGDAIASTCHQRDTDAVVMVMKPRKQDEEDLPEVIAEAMKAADVVFTPTMMGTAHTDATRDALASGTRILCLDAFTTELLASPAVNAPDYEKIRPTCHAVRDAFTEARKARVRAKGGTDIWLNLEGRPGNSHDGIVDAPGAFSCTPNIEVNISPVDGEGDGVIVVDGSIPHFGIGVLDEPVRLAVEKGYVRAVEGGRQASMLRDLWERENDPNVYLVAQLAIGLNPHIRFVNGIMLNDHGVWGTVHFGIGTSMTLGGTTRASTHLDGIVLDASVWLDDELVLDDGQLLVGHPGDLI